MLIVCGTRLSWAQKKEIACPLLEVVTRCSYRYRYPADSNCVTVASDIRSQGYSLISPVVQPSEYAGGWESDSIFFDRLGPKTPAPFT